MTSMSLRMTRLIPVFGALLFLTALTACAQSSSEPVATTPVAKPSVAPSSSVARSSVAQVSAPKRSVALPSVKKNAVAIFAGGCFWCMEPPFDKLPGVTSTISGYIGGRAANPTYEQVSAGGTGHTEAVQVTYDPGKVSYATLLDVFWRNIDPVAVDRQFCDAGDQYRSAIFPVGAEQQRLAEASKRTHESSGRFDQPIATEIVAATRFYAAEDYHQDYYMKNPARYKFYRYSCGRDKRLEQVWGKART